MAFEGGRWGIVILISAFMIQVLVFGVSGAIGVYNIEFLQYFKASASEVSVVAALNLGVFLGSGPIVSFLMTKFSYRKIALGGSVVVILGLLAVPVFPNLYMLYLTVGVLVGFGSSCVYIPSHILSGLYYNKYRSLATGVVTSGSGLGIAMMPVLVGLFIEMYSWKGSFIILAGLCLHLFIFSSFLRSPPSLLEETEKRDTNGLIQEGDSAEAPNRLENGDGKISQKFSAEQNKVATTDEFVSAGGLDKDRVSDHLLEKNEDFVPEFEDENLQNDRPLNDVDHLPESARHIYIFKNYNFVIYFINNYFWNASSIMVTAFIPEYFRLRGSSILEASWLVGFFGLGCFLGGILGGVLGNISVVNRTVLFILSCILLGVSTLLVPPGQSFEYFATMMFFIGLSFGLILGLLVVVLADLVGIKSLGNGMGYLMLSNGIGTFTGPIFAGIVIDSTGSYESTLYLSGIASLVSGAIMCLIPLRQYFKGCRKASMSVG